MINLTNLSNEKLIKKCRAYMSTCLRQQTTLAKKEVIIRHYKNKLKQISNSIDYLLEHPYSRDCSNRTKKHKRDSRGKIQNEHG